MKYAGGQGTRCAVAEQVKGAEGDVVTPGLMGLGYLRAMPPAGPPAGR
jgi:hypothetical protein